MVVVSYNCLVYGSGDSSTMHDTFQLDADHFQFYLEDLAIEHDTSLLWDATADPLLQMQDGLIAIGTARWGLHTSVTIEVHQQPPHEDGEAWEHMREARLRTISGHVHLTAPEVDHHTAPVIPLAPGIYNVRAFYGNLSSVQDELAPHGNDHYKLVLWPER